MKSWAFAAMFICVGALAACDDDGTGGSGGAGGGDGGAGGSTTTNPMTTTTTTASGNTGGGGGGGGSDVFDTGNPADCGDQTSGCIGCALNGNCSDELATCMGNQDCQDFAVCFQGCADQACADQCIMDHPEGAGLYNEILNCVVCVECPIACDGPGSGCM